MAEFPSIDTDLLRTFVAIADHGGFTRAADAVNRTQSAVSMQMKRLEEDVLHCSLFQRDGRTVSLTPEGAVLLGYARRILKLHGEVLNTLRQPQMVGTVRIGSPDDYVMRFLPGVLSRFAQDYPLINVEVHCESSAQLLQRNDLDLTIVTREPGAEKGQLLRQERFVWMVAQGFSPHEKTPVPLAMFNTDCFCRTWACNALDMHPREYRVAYTSASLAAINAVVSTGLAITAQFQSLLTPGLRIVGEAENLPLLPVASIVLLRKPDSTSSPIIECFADYIVEGFKL
ncbi:LysR substrate-binding domain-containing protein [Pseudomonas sp.]|uniref:LysR substrate-binding domain-containing protein n=1 Tax=Pseudomonas sp. TaxID=306 RepID=UPI00260BD0EE|nr:LysR substrate-binding domain-containing protein [Pseudomonas sp.]